MTIQKLHAELTADPLGRGYSAMTAAQAADDLNTTYRQLVEFIQPENLILWAADGGRLQKLLNEADRSQAAVGIRSACRALAVTVTAFEGVNPADERWATLLNAIVSAGILTAADRTALVDEATVTTSRAAELGLGTVAEGDVIKARAYPAGA